MIVQKDLLSMEFYKKAVYTGSEGNMRFRIERVEVPKDSYDPITGIVVPKTVEDLDDSEEGEGDAAGEHQGLQRSAGQSAGGQLVFAYPSQFALCLRLDLQ